MRRRAASSRPSSLATSVTDIVATFLVSLTWLTATSSFPRAGAVSFTPAPATNLDLSQLGRIAFAGNFDSISLFQFEGQNENSFNTNGSQSLLAQYPTGAFATLSMSDGYIRSMCEFVRSNGTSAGVFVGGNFTSLGGVEAQGVALWNPDSGDITPLSGLSGQVSSVYCDKDTSTVYVGGSFTGANSTNAIAYTTQWSNLPFGGMNGPVSSIMKAPNGNIVFGGSFDGLGNATSPKQHDMQVIPVSSANITANPSSGTPGFTDPKNIICKTGDQDGSGNTWLLADNVAGFWDAKFAFGFVPTKLRLYNTNQDGRGTKTWRFTALPINGIMRFTYIDSTGANKTCDSECPLPQNNQTAQDFHFVNTVGMNEFRIDISAWYGSGGGLAGIELFQDDIYSYAINDFNEPKCDGVSPGTATATTTGNWVVTPSGSSTSEYLSTTLTGDDINPAQASVVFEPNIRQSGNYSVTVYTPGCIQDNTCTLRGRVNVTGMLGSTGTQTASQPYSTMISQTNNFDKYDQIFVGYVDMTSDSFKPSVTLSPASGQDGPLTVVAQRVRFELITSSGGLNGLFEYNPSDKTVSTDFSKSAIDTAGTDLSTAASVVALVTQGSNLFVAGNFSNENFDNIFSVGTGKPGSLPGGGLNGQVATMFQNDTLIYVGGQFTNTKDNTGKGMNGVAVYDTSSQAWRALGSGVNGSVTDIVEMQLNFTANQPSPVIAISGYFDQVLGTGDNSSFAADGIALWDPVRLNWVNNLGLSGIAISGMLSAAATVQDHPTVYAGNVASAGLSAGDAAGITSNGETALQQLPIDIQPATASSSSSSSSNSTLRKRAVLDSTGSIDGATVAFIHDKDDGTGVNITAIGGHFTSTASNGSTISNLLVINGSSATVSGFASGVDESSTVYALGISGNVLYVGGDITGTVNGDNVTGLVLYDLNSADYADPQPATLTGGSSVTVNAIAAQPSTTQSVYVGGSFTSAGNGFSCPALCIWDTARQQWNSPGSGLGGSVQAMAWMNNDRLIVGGNLTVNGTARPLTLYDRPAGAFEAVAGTDSLPGPVTAVCAAASDGNTYWVAGTSSSNGQSYIQKFDGTKWTGLTGLTANSVVQSIQVFTTTSNHGQSDLLAQNQALMVLGDLGIPGFGNASAAVYNGSTFTPFLLANAQGAPGRVSQLSVQNPENFFKSGGKSLPYRWPFNVHTNSFVQVANLPLASLSSLLSPLPLVSSSYLLSPVFSPREYASDAKATPELQHSHSSTGETCLVSRQASCSRV